MVVVVVVVTEQPTIEADRLSRERREMSMNLDDGTSTARSLNYERCRMADDEDEGKEAQARSARMEMIERMANKAWAHGEASARTHGVEQRRVQVDSRVRD